METKNNQSLISWRRWFHMHPETSGNESKTAAYLADELSNMGLVVKENIFGYGLTAQLDGKEPGKCIALRADMDALPVMEESNLPYKSLHDGVMHACGHDAHMAILLGTAAELIKDPPPGKVKFIFQPSEEKQPGGAKYLIEAGVLNNPKVDAILGLHVSPSYPVGTIALKEGELMAISDNFELTIQGRGGHGAAPHLTVDPIMVTAQVIQGLQHIISRKVNPAEPAVISVGTIHGGTTQNIIPDEVTITGTVRSINQTVREKIVQAMNETLNGFIKAYGAKYQLNYIYGYPPVVNHPEITRMIMNVVRDRLDLNLEIMDKPLMIGEDFSYYGINVPAAYFFLGCGSKEKNLPLHHSSFDIEEACLPIGVEIMTQSVYKFLRR